jgi:hypothetical protein
MKTGTSIKTAASILFLAAFGLTPLAAQQELAVGQTLITYTPHFFMAVVGGVILAIGFQLLLTSLSVASGISLIGNVEETFTSSDEEGKPSRKGDQQAFTRESEAGGAKTLSHEQEEGEKSSEGMSPIVKISNAIGIWTVVTASVSLFFASLLAVRLTLVGTVWMGITLGLIIWAAFFATMAYLEIRSVSTLIGGVLTAAFSGMRASFASARNVFAGSPQSQLAKAASASASALREELSQALDPTAIEEKLDSYVKQLRPQKIDLDRVKADLTDILRNVHLEETSEISEGHLDRQTFIRLAQDQPSLKKEDADKLGNLFEEVRSSLGKEGKGSEKVEDLARKMAGNKADAAKYQVKLENYLRQTGREELDPERIKHDIDQIFEDPKSSREVLLNRLNSIDRNTLVALLAQREGMTEEKASKWIGNVERAIHFVREKVIKAGGAASGAAGAASESASKGGAQLAGLPKEAEDRIREYMSSIGRPEFDYDRIRLDFERMLHDPKASLKILRARMKLYDRDSLVALLSSRKDVSEEDAERMVSKIEEARDNVLQRAENLENEVRRRLTRAKQMALHEAENVRKASATAAWWMVGTAVVSGAFSALGAALAITL